MGLQDLIRRDSERLLADTAGFAEEIVYRDANGVESPMTAHVFRAPLSRQREDKGRTISAPIEIEILRSACSSPAVGDEVQIKPRAGQAAKWMKVTEIVPRSVAEDAGVWRLGIGR